MPRAYRLTVADLKAFRADRRFSGSYFSLSVGKASRTGVACVVSKKVSARAVDRNRVKRRFRAALSPHLTQLSSGSYVWYAKKEAASAEYADVRRDIEKLVARIA
jgi:ribonuclease P protein component